MRAKPSYPITHANMDALLDRLATEQEFQPGQQKTVPDAWYREQVILEFPSGELCKGALASLALLGRRAPVVAELTGKEGFNAQGLEGKVVVRKDLFGALMNRRDILPEYRGRIVSDKGGSQCALK